MRADIRYCAGGSPCTARNARLKSPALEKPHLAAMAATGRGASAGSERSRRQHSSAARPFDAVTTTNPAFRRVEESFFIAGLAFFDLLGVNEAVTQNAGASLAFVEQRQPDESREGYDNEHQDGK